MIPTKQTLCNVYHCTPGWSVTWEYFCIGHCVKSTKQSLMFFKLFYFA